MLKLFCIWSNRRDVLGFILNMRAQVDNVAIDFIPSIGVTQDSILLAIKSLYSSTCILILCKNIIIYIFPYPSFHNCIIINRIFFFFFSTFYIKKGGTRRKRKKSIIIIITSMYIWKGKKYCTFWQFMLRVLEHFI